MKKAKLLSFKYILFDFIRITAIPSFLWFRPKCLYLNDKAKKKIRGGALLISNHVGFYDPLYLMIILWYRRHHFIATTELFHSKLKRFIFTKIFKCIEIDRTNFSIATFRNIVDHLKNGELVSMFPEGHVNLEAEGIKAFKSGMVMMALKSGVPIIPVYLQRKKHIYSRLVLGVGEPINIDDFKTGEKFSLEDINKASLYLYEQEKKLEELVEGAKQ